MSGFKKAWREAATLLITARTTDHRSKFNYKILCMKRSEKTSFMQNNISFPGGAIEAQDESTDWLQYFKESGISESLLQELEVPQETCPFIFQSNNSESLKRVISLRLTAIRETFEEVGVLLCRQAGNGLIKRGSYGNFIKNFDVSTYQKKIHDHQITFLEMCRELKIIPDLWSLYEWSDWLTPTFFGRRRYDTIFFIVSLNDQPPVLAESTEAQSYMWRSPLEYLDMSNRKEIFVPPPQFCEFSRLLNFTDQNNLIEFYKTRENRGVTLIMPVQFRCSDGLALVAPGDDAYPNPVNYVEEPEQTDRVIDATLNEFRQQASRLNRSEIQGPHDIQLHSNVDLSDMHKLPIKFEPENALKANL